MLHKWSIPLIASFLDSASYVYFVNSCKEHQSLKKNKNERLNSVFERIKVLHHIFDLRRNVFITGSAGCGKTYLLNRIYEIAERHPELCEQVMTATTGAACLNLINGQTIHSFSGLRKGTIPIDALAEKLKEPRGLAPFARWKKINLLILDEVSMLGKRFIDKIDLVARTVRQCPNRPFGGIQVIFSGDFLQLPPVGDKFSFTSTVWKELNLFCQPLTFPYRQCQDLFYYDMLQRIRIAKPKPADIELLEQRVLDSQSVCYDDMKIKPTHIFTFHKDVDKMNQDEFQKLTTPIEHVQQADDEVFERKQVLVNGKNTFQFFPTNVITAQAAADLIGTRVEHVAPRVISFRVGAQYILTSNFSVKRGLVNGSRMVYLTGGFFEFMSSNDPENVKPIEAVPDFLSTFYFSVPRHQNLFLRRRQYAVRLGYAVTIHSSQGMSMDCASIDLGKTFGSSMAYTALSRLRSLHGLYLKSFAAKSIRVNEEARRFLNETVMSA
jgi:ATP-dependent DNA helicase PIF1